MLCLLLVHRKLTSWPLWLSRLMWECSPRTNRKTDPSTFKLVSCDKKQQYFQTLFYHQDTCTLMEMYNMFLNENADWILMLCIIYGYKFFQLWMSMILNQKLFNKFKRKTCGTYISYVWNFSRNMNSVYENFLQRFSGMFYW